MPLDRRHVTVASRIMVPAYPLFVCGVGLSLVMTPTSRLLETPAFRYAADLAPLRAWGAGFLIVTALLLGALALRSRGAYVAGLAVMVAWMGGWAALLLASAIQGASSWSAWTWPAFVGIACFSTMSSLLSREV